MTDGPFVKLAHSESNLYGERKLFLCGFPAAAQPKFMSVLEMAETNSIPLIWLQSSDRKFLLKDLMNYPADYGAGTNSELPRTIIVAGITENELHRLMDVCQKTGMKSAVWATLTPKNENWSLGALLEELQQEHFRS